MPCTNCFNGCIEIISDKCVKYTGDSFPTLNIENGDTLASIEVNIFNILKDLLTGVNIIPVIDETTICTIVQDNLPECAECTEINLNQYIEALVKSACSLQEQINAIDIPTETPYNLECLAVSENNTYNVVQALITKLCAVDVTLQELILDIQTNYVTISEVNNYIANYLTQNTEQIKYRTRMVPYSILPFFGSLSDFDATGRGTGVWESIYLCNGNNGTPDLRGRTLVGTTTGMNGPAFPSETAPGGFNPNYTLGSTFGNNAIQLNESQIPSHTHSVSISPEGGHSHSVVADSDFGGNTTTLGLGGGVSTDKDVETSTEGEHSHTVSIGNTGGSQAHANNQPAMGVHYIIYIP